MTLCQSQKFLLLSFVTFVISINEAILDEEVTGINGGTKADDEEAVEDTIDKDEEDEAAGGTRAERATMVSKT